MKINISNSYKTPVPASGQYMFIRNATGDVDVTFRLSDREQTVTMGQGETLHIDFESVEFQARGTDQEIDFRMGFGRYTPPMSAITSSIIEQIQRPVDVSGSTVAVSGTADVSGSEVSITGNADVSGSTVEVFGQRAATVSGSEITVTAGQSVTIAANVNRSRIILQNDSNQLTKCRVSHSTAVAATGLRLIGGDGMMGEQILQTTAALKIWNTSATDAVISVFEEVA